MHPPPPAAAMPAAVMVVFRRQGEVELPLRQLLLWLPHVVVVDNGAALNTRLQTLCNSLGAHYLHGANAGGLAGAYNRALRHLHSLPPPARTVLFLDEDSDIGALPAFLADPATRTNLEQPGTAAISPAYRDRATGLRGRYMWLRRFRLGFNPREFDGVREVAFVINSMSVWRAEALQRIGPFNEGLAIDHVDTEYCLRARAAGLHVYVHGSHEFPHAIGERRRYRFLGMDVQSGGHGPSRRYLIGRNTMWLARQWLWREPAFAVLCLLRLSYEAIGIAMVEDQAGAKLWALLRGAGRGLVARLDTA